MTREEAIEKVREMKLSPGKYAELIIALYTLIPELAESEDKRIIRAINNMLPLIPDEAYANNGVTKEGVLNYLEKQKEPNAKSPLSFGDEATIAYHFGLDEGARREREKQKEQKPEERFEEAREKYQIEWSEEDENVFNDILLDMADRREMFKAKGETTFAENTQKKIDWLDSHHLQLKYQSSCSQPKQEWSEEDEKMLVAISKALGCDTAEKTLVNEGVTLLMAAGFLESLRPHWKPSEHQMNILKAVKEYVGRGSGYWGEGLGSLIEDLEKLI